MAVATLCAAILFAVDPASEAVLEVIRWTARTSLVLFAFAYVARPAAVLWPSAATKRLLRERTWIGNGFAVSHLFHLGGIIAFAVTDWATFRAGRGPETLLAGAAYVLIVAMSITSIDRVRAALTRRAWDVLHRTGIHVVWVVFVGSYAKRLANGPFYPAALGVLVTIAAIRAAAWLRARRRTRTRASVAA